MNTNKNVNSCRKLTSARMAAMLFALLFAVILTLSSCTGGEGGGGGLGGLLGGNGQEPVYTGMTIGDTPSTSAGMLPERTLLSLGMPGVLKDNVDYTDTTETGAVTEDVTNGTGSVSGDLPGNQADQKDPFDQVEEGSDNSDILLEDAKDSLQVQGAAKPIYYAQKNQDIYITVHIDNPDSFEILSFTLNGNKYSSYMFEPGSDMENLILKVNVGDVEGVQDYTIDAIKYVDGTDIKDVRMDGDKTVRAGVWSEKQPVPIVKNENIGFNDISLEITMDDTLSLIEKSEGTVMAVIYNGEQVLEMQPITLGQQNAITFGGLTTNALYQYAIIAYYDALDGTGSNVYVLETKAFYTRAILLFDNVKVGTETIDYDLVWAEDAPDKTVTSLVLEHAVVGMVRLDGTTTSISDLLSNNDYVLTASYQNGSNTESIVINFTTAAKTVPSVTVSETSVSQTEIGFALNVEDPDGIAQLTKLELISDKTGTVDLPLDAIGASGLLSDTEYIIRATYTYDLNDRGGAHELVAETKVKTQAKTLPILTLRNESVGQDLFSFDLTLTDPDGIATLTRIQLLCNKTGEVIELPLDARNVEGLLTGTAYLLEAFYTYDLNDGMGLQETSTKLAINTVPKAVPVVNIAADKITQEDVTINLSVEDPDAIGTLTRIELLCDKTDTVEFSTDAREFSNLLSDTNYTFRVWVSYDLADGNGVQETSYDLKIKTYPKTEPTYKVTEQDKTHDTITVNTSETDPDNVGNITDLSIYLGDELIASSETFDTALFAQLQGNTTYTIVLTYAYDLNNGEGVIQKTVSINVLTKVHFLPIGAEISNTSAVSEGEYVYIDISVENPNGAVVKFVKINGKTYPIIENMSTAEKVRVGIKHENQFSGGLTDFVVESLTASANGETHEYFLTDNNVATVFINGKLLVESIGVVDGEGTLIDYAFPSDFIGLYVALSNETGYDINSIKIRDYHSNWNYSEYTFTSDQIIMLDQNTALIPLRGNEYRWGGYHDYQVTEVTYSNFSITVPKTITVETEKYNVVYFESDEIIEVSKPEDLKNMNTWAYYKLVNDIDLSGIEWKDPQMFRGYFDGGYYTIKNMRVVTTFENQEVSIGLFSNVTGKIFNLNLTGIDVNFTASNTLDTWYYVYYGAIAPHANGRIVFDNVRIEQRVAITTRGQHINAYAGALLSSRYDDCYVSNSVICTGSVVCNSSTMSNTNLGQSISKLPAKPSFDQDSDPSLYFDSVITKDGVSYLCLSNGIAIVIGFDGSVNDVVIGLDGYKITSIPSKAFYNYDNITSVVIPEGVITIGYKAFANCEKLASITLPETLVEIGSEAFRENHALTSITLPASLKTIGEYAFCNCNQLTEIVIPEGVTKIGNCAFQSCWSVTEITLPSTLTTIGYSSFSGTNVKTVFIPISVTTIDNHAFSENTSIYAAAAKAPSGWSQYWNGEKASNVTWGVESIITDASGVKYALMGNKTAHAIGFTGSPNAVVLGVEGYTLTSITPYAFQNCNTLVSITIPDTVTELGEYAFHNCNILKSVTLSNNLTKISKYAFNDCDALVSIVIPEGVKVIEDGAFASCNNLTSVTLPDTLTTIERQAFHYCDIRELVIPNSVVKIGEHAFAENRMLSSLTLSSALTSIENYTFAWSERLQNIVIPEGITTIGEYAFAWCYDLRGVTLPNTLTTIGSQAFYGAYTQIVFIPASVTTIGTEAFYSGTIYTCVPEAPTGWNPSWNGSGREEYVVWGVEKYLTDEYGVTYVLFADGTASIAGVSGTVSEIVLGGHPDFPVTEIPANLLNGRSDITKITIHQSITKIGANAFSGGNRRHIQLPITVEEIGENAFGENYVYVSLNQKLSGWHENWYGWNSNTVIWDAPDGEFYTDEIYGNTYLLTNDGWAHLYRYNYQNSELTIAGVDGYKVIVHSGSTNGNHELRKLTLLEGVVKLDVSAFRYYYSLKEIILPASLEEIGAYAFANTSIDKLVLSDSIKTIEKEAFTSGSIFVTCATKPAGWSANWCTSTVVWDYKDVYTDENGISYVLTNGGYAYVYNYDREAKEITVVGVDGYKTVITNVFRNNSNLTRVTLAEGVVEIAADAFNNCYNLKEISLPSTLKVIGDCAFISCYNLIHITLPEGLESIGAGAFNGGGNRHIKLPATVATIGENAFSSNYVYVSLSKAPAEGWAKNWNGDSNNVIWNAPEGEFYTDENGMTYLLTADGWAHLYRYETKQTLTINGVNGYKTIVHSMYYEGNGNWSVHTLILGEGVVKLEANAFRYWYNLESVALPSTLTEIGSYAFYECSNLRSILLPTTVTTVGESAFTHGVMLLMGTEKPTGWHEGWYTGSATNVYLNVKELYTDENGVSYALTNTGLAYVYGYSGDWSHITISGIAGYDVIVTSIFRNNSSIQSVTLLEGAVKVAPEAFMYCHNLQSITLPASLVEIGSHAFYGAPIEGLTIPATVQKIEDNAFNCNSNVYPLMSFKPAGWADNWYSGEAANVLWNFKEFYVDEASGITYMIHNDGTASVYSYEGDAEELIIGLEGYTIVGIYPNAFRDADFSSITLPEGLVSIGAYAFYHCYYLEQVTLPSTLTEIGAYAFYDCDSLTKVEIPDGVTKISSYSFYDCDSLKTVAIPDGVTKIESNAFYSCSNLQTIVLPSKLTEIGDHAFAECYALKNVNLPEGLTKIGNGAFQSCNHLQVTLPSTLVEIGNYAFRYTGSPYIVIPASVTTIGNQAFTNGYIFAYADKKPAGWDNNWNGSDRKEYVKFNFEKLYTDSYGVTYALFNNKTATLVSFDGQATEIVLGVEGYTLQEIPNNFFYNNSNLTSVIIPEGVTKIGEYAFQSCYNLESVTLPSTLTKIGNYAFQSCNLREIVIPGSVSVIGNGAFESCNNLTKVVISEGTTEIGNYAFRYCYCLASITLPNTLTTIGEYAFYEISGSHITVIPASVTSTGDHAFNNGTLYSTFAEAPEGWSSTWCDRVIWNVEKYFTDEYGVTYIKYSTEDVAHIVSINGTVSEIVLGGNPDYPVTEIPAYLLQNRSGITSVIIDPSITIIGDYAFYNTNLHVRLPSSVTTIGEYAFYNCCVYTAEAQAKDGWHESWNGGNSSRIIWNAPAGTFYTNEHGMTYLLTEDGLAHLYYYERNETVTIYAVEGYDVIVHSMYYEGFGDWYVKTLILEEGVVKIEANAFRNWYYLESITLPSTLTEIGAYAFNSTYCSRTFFIPAAVTTIGEYAIDGSMITVEAAEKPEGWHEGWCCYNNNVYWGFKEFYTDDSGMTYVLTHNGKAYLFSYDTTATEITVGGIEGYEVIVPADFFSNNGNIEQVTLLEGVVEIGERAFQYCSNLKTIVLPNSLRTIGTRAFAESHCRVYLPATVTTIGDAAFNGGYIYTAAAKKLPGWHDTWFGHNNEPIMWNIPEGNFHTAENGNIYLLTGDKAYLVYYGGEYQEITVGGIEGYGVIIPDNLFMNRSEIKKITLLDGVVEIGANAFNNTCCIVIIPASVEKIGTGALNTCYACVVADEKPEGWADNWYNDDQNGKNIYVYWSFDKLYTDDNGITYALTNKGVAYVCGYEAGMTEITIGGITVDEKSYDIIISGVFQNDQNIVKVTLLDGVIVVDDRAFRQCSNLKELTLPETLTEIGYDAFYECSSLTVVVLPDSLQKIEDHAFCHSGCHVYLPATVETIEQNAFYGCDVLTSVSETQENWHNQWYGWDSNRVIWNVPAGTLHVTEDGSIYLLTEDNVAHLFFYEKNSTDLTINAIPGYDTVIHGTTYGDWSVEKLTIGEGVIKLADNAFYNWDALKEVSLPSTLTEIGSHTFYNCDSLTSIVIPEGVKVIGESAFRDCSNLTDVTLPSTLTEIGSYTFYNCDSLTSIVIPEGVKVIGESAFSDCSNLTDVTLPSTLTEIGAEAFRWVPLVDVRIPAAVTTIGAYAFTCENVYPLANAKPEGWHDNWYTGSTNAVLWNFKEFYVDEASGITYIIHNDNTASVYSFDASSGVTNVVIGLTGDYADYTVIAIYPNVFSSTSITSVVIPEGVTVIGNSAFSSCYSLTSVTLPSTLKEIGASAFYHCNSSYFTAITFPAGLTTIGDNAFQYCYALQSIKLPDSVTTIGNCAFYNCHNAQMSALPGALVSIGYEAFSSVQFMQALIIPQSVITIGSNALHGNVIVFHASRPEGWSESWHNDSSMVVWNVKEIYVDTTYGVTYVLFNDGTAAVIGFDNRHESVVILSEINGCTVTEIAARAFYESEEIETIQLPDTLLRIGESAFNGCHYLKKINLPGNLQEIGSNAFYDCDKLTSIVIPDSVTVIGDSVFYDCDGLQSVTMSNTLTKISSYTFYSCEKLTSVVIPESVTEIGAHAFQYCSALTSIVIPEGVTTIGEWAFYNSGLTSVVIPDSVTKIERYAFSDCYSLQSVTLPNGLTEIAEYTFSSCYNLHEIVIPDSVTKIGRGAFESTGLRSVVIPESVSTICTYAFNTSYLQSAVIPSSVTTVEDYAFTNGTIYVRHAQRPADWTNNWNGENRKEYVVWNFDKFHTDEQGVVYALMLNDTAWVIDYQGDTANVDLTLEGYTVTTIKDEAFRYCLGLVSIIIPESVTKIGAHAFYDCDKLTEVVIPESVTEIGDQAFYDCDDLTSVVIPQSVTSMGYGAFMSCSNAIISAAASEQPSGWDNNWCDNSDYIIWNFKELYTDEQGVTYALLNDRTAIVWSYTGTATEIDLTLEGYTVTKIKANAFYNCDTLVSVVIPEGVTTIGEYAFYHCNGLTSVVIPEGVTEIGDSAFSNCDGLTSVVIPESVTEIGNYAFSNCDGLTSVVIPKSVTEIGYYAFYSCYGLTEIVIPESVTTMGYGAFMSCSNAIISAAASEQPVGWDSNWCGNSDQIIWNCKDIYTDGQGVVYALLNDQTAIVLDYEGTATEIDLTLKGYTVTAIKDYVFKDCDTLVSVVIPEGVTTIGKGAFSSCEGLTSVVIPESVTTIGEYAFYYCYNLTSVIIPEGVTEIGEYAFYYCSALTSVVLPESMTAIGSYAFYNCNSLSSIVIPESVTSMGYGAFMSCPNAIIGVAASEQPTDWDSNWRGDSGYIIWNVKEFYTNEQGVTYALLNNQTAIVVAYKGTASEIDLTLEGYTVTKIKANAFYNCGTLVSVVIPKGVTEIGAKAFYDCDSLTSVVIPEGVTTIGNRAFYSCNGLTSVYIPDGVSTIGEYAFYSCNGLTSLVIPESVTTIGEYAFSNCDGLTSIVIPEGVTTIGEYAFSDCDGLTSIVIPESVAEIGEYAFYDCNGLISVVIPESVTTIGLHAFYASNANIGVAASEQPAGWSSSWCWNSNQIIWNCTEIYTDGQGVVYALLNDQTAIVVDYVGTSTEIDLTLEGYTVTKIKANAFYNCDTLESVVIPEGVTEIGEYAFYGCNGLTSVVIPDSVTTIGYYAFSDCYKLTSVVIPEGVTTISEYAFYYCSSLTSIVIPDSVTTIGYAAFENCWNATFYVTASEQPAGWDSNWTNTPGKIVWGYTA